MIIPVVVAVDDNFVRPLAVTIQSLINHKSKNLQLKIFVFYEDLSAESKAFLSNLQVKGIGIEFVDVKEFLKQRKLYESYKITVAMYYRLLIPEILQQFEKCVYLDCDVVVKKCISTIYNIDLKDKWIAGVHECWVEDKQYINSGVIVFNLKKCRENNFSQKCLDYVDEHQDLLYPDQDTINHVCKDNIFILPYNYNYISSVVLHNKKIRECGITKIKDLVVIHYTSQVKPWIYVNHPLAKYWWKEANKLPVSLKNNLYETYKTDFNYQQFDSNLFKFVFSGWFYKFIIKARIKIVSLFKRKK